MVPEGFDPESCWSIASASDPVIVDDTVFALLEGSLVAFDADSGKQIWTSGSAAGSGDGGGRRRGRG